MGLLIKEHFMRGSRRMKNRARMQLSQFGLRRILVGGILMKVVFPTVQLQCNFTFSEMKAAEGVVFFTPPSLQCMFVLIEQCSRIHEQCCTTLLLLLLGLGLCFS